MNIVIIGDSNTLFMAGNMEAIRYGMDGGNPRGIEYKTINGTDIVLIYESGLSAYWSERIHSICNEIPNNSVMVFQFGTADIQRNLYKYDNADLVVKKYVQNSVQFARKFGVNPMFIQPITDIKFKDQYDKFTEELREECSRLGLDRPIEILGKFMDWDYPRESGDNWHHASVAKSQEILGYIVDYIKAGKAKK
jgi:hypothetical protein